MAAVQAHRQAIREVGLEGNHHRAERTALRGGRRKIECEPVLPAGKRNGGTGRTGKAGKPGEPFGRRGKVFALILVGMGDDETGETVGG